MAEMSKNYKSILKEENIKSRVSSSICPKNESERGRTGSMGVGQAGRAGSVSAIRREVMRFEQPAQGRVAEVRRATAEAWVAAV